MRTRDIGRAWAAVSSFLRSCTDADPDAPDGLDLVLFEESVDEPFYRSSRFLASMEGRFGEVKRRGATTFEISEDANQRYLDRMTDLARNGVWTIGDCGSSRSYYFNPSGEATLLRPMTVRQAIREASEFPLSDYQID